MNLNEIKDLLEVKVKQFNQPDFIQDDPISIPHQFQRKQDIEIAGFFMATIAWGKRSMIINNGYKLMELMNQEPYEFVMNAGQKDLKQLNSFVHRTFQAEDLQYFIKALQKIYQKHDTLEKAFIGKNQKERLINFHHNFLSFDAPSRTYKHIANPGKGSSAKRLNMFLRWMVRKDNCGVDFGIWNEIPMSDLHCPLDVHTGNIARKLGLIKRKANDWKAVEELQKHLVKMDPQDPSKYDFALFGLGVYNEI